MHNSAEQILDQILVLDAQSGSVKAFEKLILRWQKRFWWHAYNITGRTEAAWDITQESWLSIVKSVAGLKDPAKFGPWAYQIVTRRAKDWLQRNSKEPVLPVERSDHVGLADDRERSETASDVHSIIRRLPARSRSVLALYYFEGFGVAEVAKILDTAEGTVKSRLHTARREFRKLWESLCET